MHFPEYVLFISGKRIEESNSACEERHIVVGQMAHIKAQRSLWQMGMNCAPVSPSNSPFISFNIYSPT